MFNIFQKKSIGIDIADHTIEAVELVKRGTKIEVSNRARAFLKPGIVEAGRIKDEKKLSEAVKEIFSKAKPQPIKVKGKPLIFGLPESQVYIYIFELGPHKKKDREDLILKEARTNIPLEEDDLLFSYKVLDTYKVLDMGKDKKEVLLVAASKKQVLEWQQFFQNLGLEVEIFDIESLATFRGLFNKPPRVPVCLVDIGAATTNIAVFDKRGLRYSRSINIAGDIFTQEIAKALEIKLEKAEEQKIKIGLSDENSQIFPVLIELLEPINKEVKTLLNYFQEKNNQPVQEIILVGGSSKLKGIDIYFKENLELPVKKGKLILPTKTEFLEYIEAVGLALRGLDKKWSQKDPGLQPIKIKTDKPTKNIVFKEKLPSLENIEKEEESVFSSVAKREQKKKLGFKKVLLITILIIGLIVIALAYWYRSYEKAQKEKEIESQIIQYTQTQSFDLKISLAVDSQEYADDRARARIVEDIVETAGHYNEAVAHSRAAVQKELKEGESLWPTPINAEQNVFPMTIKWVVYSEKDADGLFLKEIDKLNKDKIDYMLNNIEKNHLEPTDNPNVFYLTARVTISLNELIKEEKEEEESGPEEEEEEKIPEEIPEISESVIIKETPTGWLRVREEPGIGYPEIAKVYPGESYPLLEESGEWYKIKIDEEIKGWVFSMYVNKVNE